MSTTPTSATRIQAAFFEWAPAAFVAAVAVYESIANDPRGGIGPNLLAGLAFAALVAWRRRGPATAVAAAWVLVAVLQSAFGAMQEEASTGWLSYIFLIYAFGRSFSGRDSVAAMLLMVGGIALVYAVAATSVAGDFFYPEVIGAGIWLAGRTMRQRAQMTRQLRELAEQAQQRVEREAALAQAQERRRLAREMHDVVGHSISVMVVQAGGARRILPTDPERAAQAAALVERTGREALGELRRVLGLLESELDSSGAPAPGVDDLPGLLQRGREAGLDVQFTQAGNPASLAGGAELAVYRIVQESLTNALRHAGPVRTEVALRWEPEVVAIEVINAAGTGDDAGLSSGGHGLIGMAERAKLYGGSFDAAPTPDGGFRVTAQLRREPSEVAVA